MTISNICICTHIHTHIWMYTNGKYLKEIAWWKWSLENRSLGQKWDKMHLLLYLALSYVTFFSFFFFAVDIYLLCPLSWSSTTTAISILSIGHAHFLRSSRDKVLFIIVNSHWISSYKVGQNTFANEGCFTNAKYNAQNVSFLGNVC